MKKAGLIICCAFLGFAASAQVDSSRNAFKPQSDTSRNSFRSNPSQSVQSPALQQTQPVQPQTQYRVEDRVLIQHDQLPNSLRETLMGNQYKGWENSTIYQDRTSGEYYYSPSAPVNNGTTPNTNTNRSNQSQPGYMRFDRSGQPITQPRTGGNDGGQQ